MSHMEQELFTLPDYLSSPLFLIVLVGFGFVRDSCFIHVICVYFHIVVSNTISISDDIRVV